MTAEIETTNKTFKLKKMKVRTRLIVTSIVMFFTMIWYNPLTALVSNDSIIDYLSSLKKDLDLVSVSAVMVKGDKIVWKGAVGKANIEQDIDAKTSFEYQLGSVSKLFTGAALMKLYEDGQIDLDADINNYLPFPIRHPNFPETPITIRMLLTHTSSFADAEQLQYDLYVVGDSEMSIEELCNKYFRKNGEFYNDENWEEWEPGTKWDYCNWNFVLIGYIIEQFTQMPYHEYSQKYILDPLEMKSAGWWLDRVRKQYPYLFYHWQLGFSH
jgi:CubicO group peptidase (beta-lactamase class C family)